MSAASGAGAGGEEATRTSGGTGDLLPRERARASFDVEAVAGAVFLGREDAAQRAEWGRLFDTPEFDFTYDTHDDRGEAFKKSMNRTISAIGIMKKAQELKNTHMNRMLGMGGPGFPVGSHAQSGPSAAGNHYGIFVGAILARASDEQRAEWLPRALNGKIFGAYAQTEIGHGSNVRGLLTEATYDKSTEEFVIDSVNLLGCKAWPGCFGLAASHAVVYARLKIDGTDMGVHEFMVQLRDEEGTALPGIEVGDMGPKIGYNLVDNGYCRFTQVRIPRKNMLAGSAEVTADGKYVRKSKVKRDKGGAGGKLKYIVMIQTRVSMVYGAFRALSAAATIAIRYSAVRRQGFRNTRKDSLASGENVVLDYQVQQYRLFKALSTAFAYGFVSKSIIRLLGEFRSGMDKGDVSVLPELHATAAGLKAFCTNFAGDLIEECRRCCGGHGSLLSSGVAKLGVDYNAISPIAEGDKIVLALQTARYLVRSLQAARKGQTVTGAVSYLQNHEIRKPDLTGDVRNLNLLQRAFAWRARHSVVAAADSFEADQASGMSFDEAWNNNAVALVKAAQDHTQYFILVKFAEAAHDMPHAASRRVLEALAEHYALVRILEGGSDFIGLLSERAVMKVRATLTDLLKAIRPEAVALVDTFRHSDKELNSVLGRSDGKVYEALWDNMTKSPLNKPEYIKSLWTDVLSRSIDKKYLQAGKKQQRAGAARSRL